MFSFSAKPLHKKVQDRLVHARAALVEALLQRQFQDTEVKYREEQIKLLEGILQNETIIPKTESVPKSGKYPPASNPGSGYQPVSSLAEPSPPPAKP